MAKRKTINDERNKRFDSIASAVDELNKTFSDDDGLFIKPLSQAHTEKLSTGIMTLDRALGGGIGRGKIIEIFGNEGEGKTTLTLNIVGEQMTNHGMTGLWFDAEDSLDVQWAQRWGIKSKQFTMKELANMTGEMIARYALDGYLIVCYPKMGEHAFDAMKLFASRFDIIVVDSVTALIPQEIINKSNTENTRAAKARMMSKGLDQFVAANRGKYKTTAFMLNQLIVDMNVRYGNPLTTPGGKRLKFYAGQRLNVSRTTSDLDKAVDPIGHRIFVKVVKNRFYPPRKVAEFNLMYNGVIDDADQIVCLLTEYGTIGQLKITSSEYLLDGKPFKRKSAFIQAIEKDKMLMRETIVAANELIAAEVAGMGIIETAIIVDETDAPDPDYDTFSEI